MVKYTCSWPSPRPERIIPQMKQNAARYKKKHRIRKLLVIAVSFTIIIAGGRSLLSRLSMGLLHAVPGEQVNGGGTATVNLYSEHGILLELKTGDVLWKKACDSKTWPASLTKIMTVLAAIEETSDLRKKVRCRKIFIRRCTMKKPLWPDFFQERPSVLSICFTVLCFPLVRKPLQRLRGTCQGHRKPSSPS